MSWFGVLSDHQGPCEHKNRRTWGMPGPNASYYGLTLARVRHGQKMKHLFAAVAACVCALALLVAVPSTSFGGSGHGYKRHQGYKHGYHYRRHYGYGYRRHGYRHRGYRNHYWPSYFFSYSYYGHRPYYGYGYPNYYRRPQVIYVEPTTQVYQTSPPPAQVLEGCRMIREYQTQITVGGRLVDAYGDACLKADGSWERGQPKLVPE
jgi:hypothetical protein